MYNTPSLAIAFSEKDSFYSEVFPAGGRPIWSTVPYARKWGNWHEKQLRVASNDHGQVVVMGQCLASQDTLQSALDTAISAGNPELLTSLPGNYTALLHQRNGLTVLPDPFGHFPIYYSQKAENTIISSRADLAVGGEKLRASPVQLAMYIFCPDAQSALLSEQCSLEGVLRLTGSKALYVTRSGCSVVQRMITKPDRKSSFTDAAGRLRSALQEATELRVKRNETITADFSGGMDSTSLAFLALRHLSTPTLPVFASYHPQLPAGDMHYVERYLRLDNRLHIRKFAGTEDVLGFNYEDLNNVPWFGDLNEAASPTSWKYIRTYYKYIDELGGAIHLTGNGGDEVLDAHPAYLADLATKDPLRLISEGAAWARLRKESPFHLWNKAVRLAVTTPRKALNGLVSQLDNPLELDNKSFKFSDFINLWQPVGSGLGWLTKHASRELIATIEEHKNNLRLSDLDIGDYFALEGVRNAARESRNLQNYVAAAGYSTVPHSPFLDPNVVQAAFSVPAEKRGSPYIFKRILREALDGLVPAEILSRQSKGAYAQIALHTLRWSNPALQQMLSNSYLADLGIIEPRKIKTLLDEANTAISFPAWTLDRIVRAEAWLRGLDREEPNVGKTHQIEVSSRVVRTEGIISNKNLEKNYTVSRHVRMVAGPAGTLALLNLQADSYKILNFTARDLLKCISEEKSLQLSLERLSINHPHISSEKLECDLNEAVEKWAAEGVLVEGDYEPVEVPNSFVMQREESDSDSAMATSIKLPPASKRDFVAACAGFILSVMLSRATIRAKLAILKYFQDRNKRAATRNEAKRILAATHIVSNYYPGRAACLEVSYAAAIAAAFAGKNVTWHLGAGFDPPKFHAWIEAENMSIRTELDEPIDGLYQSFFAKEDSFSNDKRKVYDSFQ